MSFNLSRLKNRLTRIFREAGSSSTQITNANLKNYIIKHVGWNSDQEDFAAPENDLSEVKSAISTDSYIKVSLDKIYQLIFKAGYKITSKNEAAVEYLEQRIRVMEFGTGTPFKIMLQEMARDLVYYANAFWVKSRVDKIQGGLQVKGVLDKKPIGGYFRMDPTAVEIQRATDGTVSKYKLTGNEETEFTAANVVHFYIDRDAENSFGTPRVMSALEDVKIQRKIEGNMLGLIYRFAMPLYQIIIGLPEQNMMATDQEIKEAQQQLQEMPMDGMLITNERTKIVAVGAEGNAIDLQPYLDYCEKRVFSALNMSEAMMGRGGKKQDADSMEGMLHDTVKYYQSVISIFLETAVINELLLEGGYNPIFNADDRVQFEFNEINLDTKVKIENHQLNKFQSNAITFEELRHSIGYDAESIDESRLYNNMITTQSAIEIVNAKAAAENATGNGNLSNGKTASATPNGSVKSISSPSNQHGTTSAKIKESLALKEDDSDRKRQHIKDYKQNYASVYKLYKKMRNDISEKEKFSAEDITKYTDAFIVEFESVLSKNLVNIQSSGNKMELADVNIKVPLKVKNLAKKHIKKIISDIAERVNDKARMRNIPDCFDFLEYRLRFACDYLSKKSYWYAFVLYYKKQGVKQLKLNLSDDHAQDRDSIISTDDFNINQIPPFSPYCSCGIERPKVK